MGKTFGSSAFTTSLFLLLIFVFCGPAVDSSTAGSLLRQDQYNEILHIGCGIIRDVAWSPDGRILAVGGSQGLWLYTSDFQDISHFDSKVRYVVRGRPKS